MSSKAAVRPKEHYKEACGYATIQPQDLVYAGVYGTWTLTYVAGEHGLDDGARIMVARRAVSDWGVPQFEKPQAPDYTTVSTTGAASLRVFWDPRAFVRPWNPALVTEVTDGYLKPGEQVMVTFGDKRWGSPGSRAQTFPEETFEFRVLADPYGTGRFLTVPESPELRIVGGPVHHLRAIAPSQVVSRGAFSLLVRAEDVWGNPSYDYQGTVEVFLEPGNRQWSSLTIEPRQHGVHKLEGMRLPQAGLYRVRVRDSARDLECLSNPIQSIAGEPDRRLYWGDIHGQSEATMGTGTVEEYFQYGRDVTALDFLSHCANDFQITESHWQETQEVVRRYHQPDEFITFLGYEWSGNTCGGGDHNVYLLTDEGILHRSSHWLVEDRSDQDSDRYPIERLYDAFSGREDVLVIPHVGGRRADLARLDVRLSPVIEICSVHGVFEWFIRDALERGLMVGFVGGSDVHTGRPGWAPPPAGSERLRRRGGLLGLYSERLTREAVWEALRARRCYATTGERIIVDFSVGEQPMGGYLETSRPPIVRARIVGTGELKRLDLFRGTQLVCSYPPQADPRDLSSGNIELIWGGARNRGRNRQVIWDGELTIEGGQFKTVRGFGFDKPTDAIVAQDESRVAWRASTLGNEMGLLLEVEGQQGPRLTFTSEPVTFSLTLGALADSDLKIELDGPDQRVVVSRAQPTMGDIQGEWEWVDEGIQPGLNPYYLKVIQADGEMAWSSPVYVNFSPPESRPFPAIESSNQWRGRM